MDDATQHKRRTGWRRGDGGVILKGRSWFVRYSIPGRGRIDERTGARSEAEARRILRERVGDIAKGRTPAAVSNVRVGELFALVLADHRNRGAKGPESSKHLRAVFADGELARSVTSERIQRYVDARLEEGAARATVRKEVAKLRRAFRLGWALGLVAQLPVFPNVRVDNTRMVFFDEGELERLLGALTKASLRDPACNAFLPLYLTLAFWVGWRRNELLDLEWRQVDLERGTISLDPGTTKNKEARRVFLPEPALARLHEWSGDGFRRARARSHRPPRLSPPRGAREGLSL